MPAQKCKGKGLSGPFWPLDQPCSSDQTMQDWSLPINHEIDDNNPLSRRVPNQADKARQFREHAADPARQQLRTELQTYGEEHDIRAPATQLRRTYVAARFQSFIADSEWAVKFKDRELVLDKLAVCANAFLGQCVEDSTSQRNNARNERMNAATLQTLSTDLFGLINDYSRELQEDTKIRNQVARAITRVSVTIPE